MKNTKRSKLLFNSTLFLVFLLASIASASATIDCNLTSISTINRNTQLNASFNVSSDWDTINVAFEMRDTTNHINSSYSLIANVTNVTNLRRANLTFGDYIIFPDADTADLRATCYGEGGGENVSTATVVSSIVVDRSNPSISGVTNVGTNVNTNLQTLTFTYANATRWRVFHNGLVEETRTVTSNLATATGTRQISLRDSGTYYVEVYDGLNTTVSSTVTYTLSGRLITSEVEETNKIVKESIKKKKESNNKLLLIAGIVIIFTVATAILVSPKVKKRK